MLRLSLVLAAVASLATSQVFAQEGVRISDLQFTPPAHPAPVPRPAPVPHPAPPARPMPPSQPAPVPHPAPIPHPAPPAHPVPPSQPAPVPHPVPPGRPVPVPGNPSPVQPRPPAWPVPARPIRRPVPQPVPRPAPYPNPIVRPAPRPYPVLYPAPYPGSFVVLEGYVQRPDANEYRWYIEYGVQMVRYDDGILGINVYPRVVCQDNYDCPDLDTTPSSLVVFQENFVDCGAREYTAVNENGQGYIRSAYFTDDSNIRCGSPFDGLLRFEFNGYTGEQEFLVGYRTY